MKSTAAMLRQKAHTSQSAPSAQGLPQGPTRVTLGEYNVNIQWRNNPHSLVLRIFGLVGILKPLATV